jgi:hypothetical protein
MKLNISNIADQKLHCSARQYRLHDTTYCRSASYTDYLQKNSGSTRMVGNKRILIIGGVAAGTSAASLSFQQDQLIDMITN